MRPTADVVVVGAGPAGSVTALLLARRGFDVLMLDRAAFPRPKACGDCLSAAATRLLDRIGVLEPVRRAGASTIERWDIVSPDGRVAVGRLPVPALALERRILDAALLDAAQRAGARFEHLRVTGLFPATGRVRGVTTSEGALTARLVVGADGLRSVVARELSAIHRAPRLRKVSLTAHVPAPDGLAHGEMHVLTGGCVGYAPAGPGRANLTLVVTEAHSNALRLRGKQGFFREWIDRVPAIRDRVGSADPGPLLASGPFDWPVRAPAARGVALVGDAAGYFDPFTGQGIYHAIAAAELLAGVVTTLDDTALDHALRQYARAKTRLTRPTRRVQRLVEAVVSRPWVANPVLGRLAAAPRAMDRLIEVTGDLEPPRSLISPAVASSLVFPRTRRTHDPQ